MAAASPGVRTARARRDFFRSLSAAALVAWLAVAGCGDVARESGPGTEPAGTPVAVGEEPRLAVGVVRGDSAEQFHDVATPFLLPDGRLAVPLTGAGTIRVFSPAGELVESLGRPGEGPGEFVRLDAAWHRGDTVEAWDSDLHRLTRFYPERGPDVVTAENAGSARVAIPGALPGGWAVAGVASAGFGRRDRMAVHTFGLDGRHRGEVARVDGMARIRTGNYGGPDPLSPRPAFAVADGRIHVAETATPRIRVFDPAGELVRAITWRPEGTPSPERAFAAIVDSAVADADPARRENLRQRLESFPVRDRVSAFWDVLVDEEGFVWVQAFDPGRHSLLLGDARQAGPGGEWIVFSPDGRRVPGTVEMPPRLSPTEITSEDVVGIWRSELGVETVRVYPLRRR